MMIASYHCEICSLTWQIACFKMHLSDWGVHETQILKKVNGASRFALNLQLVLVRALQTLRMLASYSRPYTAMCLLFVGPFQRRSTDPGSEASHCRIDHTPSKITGSQSSHLYVQKAQGTFPRKFWTLMKQMLWTADIRNNQSRPTSKLRPQ